MEILSNSNISIFLWSLFPAIFYCFFVYSNLPFKSVRIKDSIDHLFIGLLSLVFFSGFVLLFPNWDTPLFQIFNPFIMNDVPTFSTYLFKSFIQIALIEELCKFASFKVAEGTKQRTHKNNTISTVFYMMLIGASFGIAENIGYGIGFSEASGLKGEALVILRSFTALIMHMTIGIFMGYFIAKGREEKQTTHSNMDFLLSGRTKLKKFVYSISGILLAIMVHGIYDLNLMAKHDNSALFSVIIITSCLGFSYKIFNKLKKEYQSEAPSTNK